MASHDERIWQPKPWGSSGHAQRALVRRSNSTLCIGRIAFPMRLAMQRGHGDQHPIGKVSAGTSGAPTSPIKHQPLASQFSSHQTLPHTGSHHRIRLPLFLNCFICTYASGTPAAPPPPRFPLPTSPNDCPPPKKLPQTRINGYFFAANGTTGPIRQAPTWQFQWELTLLGHVVGLGVKRAVSKSFKISKKVQKAVRCGLPVGLPNNWDENRSY